MILLWIVFAIALVFAAVVAVGAPYVPSKRKDLVDAFDELYPISKNDLVLDIGSGDGIVLREVARRGGRAVGIEINPILVLISKWLSRSDVPVHTPMYRCIRSSQICGDLIFPPAQHSCTCLVNHVI